MKLFTQVALLADRMENLELQQVWESGVLKTCPWLYANALGAQEPAANGGQQLSSSTTFRRKWLSFRKARRSTSMQISWPVSEKRAGSLPRWGNYFAFLWIQFPVSSHTEGHDTSWQAGIFGRPDQGTWSSTPTGDGESEVNTWGHNRYHMLPAIIAIVSTCWLTLWLVNITTLQLDALYVWTTDQAKWQFSLFIFHFCDKNTEYSLQAMVDKYMCSIKIRRGRWWKRNELIKAC